MRMVRDVLNRPWMPAVSFHIRELLRRQPGRTTRSIVTRLNRVFGAQHRFTVEEVDPLIRAEGFVLVKGKWQPLSRDDVHTR